ncbi:MAG: laccase domain-containing protein [Phycisphaerae bacterium]
MRLQLEEAGIERIDLPVTAGGSEAGGEGDRGEQLCTFARADEFYSHRRENGLTGRMAAVIARRKV